MVLNSYERPEGVSDTIDTAELLVNMESIFESNKDYLLVDTLDLDKKAVLICDKSKVEMISKMNEED